MWESQGFEDDSLFSGSEVKRLKGWSVMTKPGSTNKIACQTIVDILEPCNIFRSQTTKQRIAII